MPAPQKVPGSDTQHARTYLWEQIEDGDEIGTQVEVPDHADKSVQVIGTFGTGTLAIQGGNDGTNWATLTDPQGNALSFTAEAVEQISEVTRYIRAIVTGDNGATDLDVYLHVRANRG